MNKKKSASKLSSLFY